MGAFPLDARSDPALNWWVVAGSVASAHRALRGRGELALGRLLDEAREGLVAPGVVVDGGAGRADRLGAVVAVAGRDEARGDALGSGHALGQVRDGLLGVELHAELPAAVAVLVPDDRGRDEPALVVVRRGQDDRVALVHLEREILDLLDVELGLGPDRGRLLGEHLRDVLDADGVDRGGPLLGGDQGLPVHDIEDRDAVERHLDLGERALLAVAAGEQRADARARVQQQGRGGRGGVAELALLEDPGAEVAVGLPVALVDLGALVERDDVDAVVHRRDERLVVVAVQVDLGQVGRVDLRLARGVRDGHQVGVRAVLGVAVGHDPEVRLVAVVDGLADQLGDLLLRADDADHRGVGVLGVVESADVEAGLATGRLDELHVESPVPHRASVVLPPRKRSGLAVSLAFRPAGMPALVHRRTRRSMPERQNRVKCG